MILYNVTVSIDPAVENEWLQWMRETHIPDVLRTNCFIESRISRVHGEEQGGCTYAISYVAPTREKYDEYLANHAEGLQKEHSQKYDGRFAAFRTLLSIVEEFKL